MSFSPFEAAPESGCVLLSAGEPFFDVFDFFVLLGPASVTQISHLRRLNSELRHLICSIRADPLRSIPAESCRSDVRVDGGDVHVKPSK